jgi:alpha-tubulin suppressor-like RCC1 family protein
MLALAIVGWSAACGGGDNTGPISTVDVASIAIDQSSFFLERGYHQTLTTTIKNQAGETISVPVVWRSSNEKVALFDAAGRVTALDTGTTTVTASTIGITSQPIGIRVVWQGAAKIVAYQFTAPSAATPGVAVPDSVRVQVTDVNGNPVQNARVRFSSTTGGGTIAPATTVTTNNAGVAAARWTLGPSIGANIVTASVVADDDTPLAFVDAAGASFSITTFQAIRAVAGDNQTGQILSSLAVTPSVRVVDAADRPRAGVPVTFTPTAGGSVAASTVSTGADGVASPGTWTLGDIPGTQSLIVKLESAELVMTATGTGTPIHYMPVQVAAGGYATCAIVASGAVQCWGEQPKVGDGGSANRAKPTPTAGGVSFSAIAGSVTHFCGIASGGGQSIYCWGSYALVDATAAAPYTARVPTREPGTIAWLAVAPGYGHNCALAADQTVYCWGDNSSNQLGDRTSTSRFDPAQVYGSFQFASVVSGSYHSCGLTADGSALCWGNNQSGQLGDGSSINRSSPTAVGGGGTLAFQSIGAGEAWTCGLTTAGKAYCWGSLNGAKQTSPLGYPTAPAFTTLSVGGAHACALTADGTAYCWGDNRAGQLGDSTTTYRAEPTAVAGTMKFSSISAGYLHTCARTTDGSVACWGLNSAGELGDSTTTGRLTPRYLVLGVTP